MKQMKNFLRYVIPIFAVLFCSLCHAQTEEAKIRTWTSANGKHTFEAKLESVDEGDVKLRDSKGKIKKVKLTALSADDRKYVKSFTTNSPPATTTKLSSDQRDRLKELGLKYSRGEFSFVEEKELKSQINELLKAKKQIIKAARMLGELKNQKLYAEGEIVSFRQASLKLNTQLATASTVQENNRIVAMLEANRASTDLIRTEIETMESQIKEGQSQINSNREQFVQKVLDVRQYSNSFDEKMKTMDADERFQVVKKDIETKMSVETKPLGETRSLARLRKSLVKLESGVLSDTIPLSDENGSGTFEATVTINGKPPIELIVDSGASLICLPQKVADDLGIVVGSDAQKIIMTIADGSKIPGKLVYLESVRLGKFSAKNIECVVLGREATNAPSLLGMSFLGQFKFELDAAKGELKMFSVETE